MRPWAALLPADRAVPHLPAVRLSLARTRALSFGQSIPGIGADRRAVAPV